MRNAVYEVTWNEKGGRRARSLMFVALARARAHVLKLLQDREAIGVTHIQIHRRDNALTSGTSIWHYDAASWHDGLPAAG